MKCNQRRQGADDLWNLCRASFGFCNIPLALLSSSVKITVIKHECRVTA